LDDNLSGDKLMGFTGRFLVCNVAGVVFVGNFLAGVFAGVFLAGDF